MMNFFRKLFPLTQKNNMVLRTQENNISQNATTSIHQCGSQVDINLNILESREEVEKSEDIATNNNNLVTNTEELDSVKILQTRINAVCTETCSNYYNESQGNNKNYDDIIVSQDLPATNTVDSDSGEIYSTPENIIPIEINTNDKNNKDSIENTMPQESTALDSRKVVNSRDFFSIENDKGNSKFKGNTINYIDFEDILVTHTIKGLDSDTVEISSNDKNDKETMLEDIPATHDVEASHSSKTYHTLENVVPIEISTEMNELDENYISDTIVSKDTVLLNNVAERTSDHNVVENEIFLTTSNIELNNNVIDDITIQSLKVFEETLNNLNRSTLTGDFQQECLNLDNFEDLFNEVDTVNDDLLTNIRKKEDVQQDNKNVINIETIENVDIISINSSTEDDKSQANEIKDIICINSDSDDDSDDGYNSSDFEFISETEAKMDGFIVNFNLKNDQNQSQSASEPLSNYSEQYIEDTNHREVEKDMFDPGEGPSNQNKPRNEFEDRSYRNNHQIPLGDDYLELFQGIYNPLLPMCEIYFLENKSVRTSAMNSEFDGIGFDKQLALRRHQPDSSEDEFQDEAKECVNKILKMYPRENRKRRRRY